MATHTLEDGYFYNASDCQAPYVEAALRGGPNPHVRGRVFVRCTRPFTTADIQPETLRQLKEAGVNEAELDEVTIRSMFYTTALREAAAKFSETRVHFSSGQPGRYKGEAFLAVGFQCPPPEANLQIVFKILQEAGLAVRQSRWKFKKLEADSSVE